MTLSIRDLSSIAFLITATFTYTAPKTDFPNWNFAFFLLRLSRDHSTTQGVMASTGHKATHFPQPLHTSSTTDGIKFVVWTGLRNPNLLAAISASQQHPQQLQIKFTLSLNIFTELYQVVIPGSL